MKEPLTFDEFRKRIETLVRQEVSRVELVDSYAELSARLRFQEIIIQDAVALLERVNGVRLPGKPGKPPPGPEHMVRRS